MCSGQAGSERTIALSRPAHNITPDGQPERLDRVAAITALIHETPRVDHDVLVCSIVSRWPETTRAEIEQALELASAQEVELIED